MKSDKDFYREELENTIKQINVPTEYVEYMLMLLNEKFEKLDDDNLDDESFEEDLVLKMRERFPNISDYYLENVFKYINIAGMLFELNNMINDDEGEENDE